MSVAVTRAGPGARDQPGRRCGLRREDRMSGPAAAGAGRTVYQSV